MAAQPADSPDQPVRLEPKASALLARPDPGVAGVVFNIQRFSLQDGPGIRTTVFLKGCPLDCLWCHNPEGISARREVSVIPERCIACNICREVCPMAATLPGGVGSFPAPVDCMLCGACADHCSSGAREVVGREMSVAALLREILRDRIFYDDSGGGVTFSGGEPLRQPQFLRAALAGCRALGIHTAVDTSGFVCPEDLLAAAEWTDLFLYDLKGMDDARHRAHTGVSNELILANLRKLSRRRAAIWVRLPIIPGFTDDQENLEAAAAFLAGLPHLLQVNLLPFHRLAMHKARRWNRAIAALDIPSPSADQMEAAAIPFRRRGLTTRIGDA